MNYNFISNVVDYNYSKQSHLPILQEYSEEIYGEPVDFNKRGLKRYQDLLIYSFLKRHIPQGSKILEVGGGNSRVLRKAINSFECWNVDAYEGVGNGPKSVPDLPGVLVKDYMGNFNEKLPCNYFDFVFSISSLEHTGKDEKYHQRIVDDINRVLKPDGLSFHALDIVLRDDGSYWECPFLKNTFNYQESLNHYMTPEEIMSKDDVYYMPEAGYVLEHWEQKTGKTYKEFGKPVSVQILWKKP